MSRRQQKRGRKERSYRWKVAALLEWKPVASARFRDRAEISERLRNSYIRTNNVCQDGITNNNLAL
eukprot:748698-Hanusia_phi.AAC.3